MVAPLPGVAMANVPSSSSFGPRKGLGLTRTHVAAAAAAGAVGGAAYGGWHKLRSVANEQQTHVMNVIVAGSMARTLSQASTAPGQMQP